MMTAMPRMALVHVQPANNVILLFHYNAETSVEKTYKHAADMLKTSG